VEGQRGEGVRKGRGRPLAKHHLVTIRVQLAGQVKDRRQRLRCVEVVVHRSPEPRREGRNVLDQGPRIGWRVTVHLTLATDQIAQTLQGARAVMHPLLRPLDRSAVVRADQVKAQRLWIMPADEIAD
jgi:hypothetical protein